MKTIKRSEIATTLENNANSFFSMVYTKADGTKREATGRLHVANPKHTLVPGTGKFLGMSAETALKKHNNIKYFDCNIDGNPRKGQTFGKGDFRTAKIANIEQIKINGITYKVID
jgi:hypothetical protein